MNIKDIVICPTPDCVCCALTRKIMETIEADPAIAGATDRADACVALSSALARYIYGDVKGQGIDKYIETVQFFYRVIVGATGRLVANDRVEH